MANQPGPRQCTPPQRGLVKDLLTIGFLDKAFLNSYFCRGTLAGGWLISHKHTPPNFNIASEKKLLEDEPFLLG